MTEFTVAWTDAGGVPRHTVVTQTGNTPDPSLPVILLLHGMGGDIHHMSDPATSPGIQFDVNFAPPEVIDRGWHGYPNTGIWSIGTSPSKNGCGLQSALAQFGYTALNYAQVGPNDTVDVPAVELDAVVRDVLARFNNKRVALVCHSRGGLLARVFLQRHRNDLDVLSRLAGVITLHAPHQGSEVADFAANIHSAIDALRNINQHDPGFQAALNLLDSQVNSPVIPELRPSSTLLENLRAGETTPLPVSIPIHTFGGTNPRLISVFVSTFDFMSSVPQWHWPPFHWTTVQSAVIHALDGTPVSLICPEQRAGGDVLVTDARSRLPGEASHRTNRVNHANLLSDGGIQAQVRDVLQTMRSNAAFIAQTVPQNMVAGATYPISITLQNTGTSTWISGVSCPFRLGTQNPQDNLVWGIQRKDVPGPVAPGGTATFQFNVTAPVTTGSYHFQWRMLQDNVEWFGAATPDVLVQVTQVAIVVSHVAISPGSLVSGEYLTVTVTLASAAPAGGISVQLASSHPGVVSPASPLTVPAGATAASTRTRAASVPVPLTVTLTATAGNSSASASVLVSPSAAYPYGTAMAVGVGGSLI